MKEIICPVDFSATSQTALKYAAELAQHFSAQLTVIHIYEFPVLYGDAPFLAVQQLGSEIEESAGKNLESSVERIAKSHPSLIIEKILESGIPSSEIIRIAEERKPDLLVMGTKGLSAIERLFIGSTTERVFHHAGVPVLCIPENAVYKAIQKMVFATDLKEDNLKAAAAITYFARSFNAELHFIYIDTDMQEGHEVKTSEMTEKIRNHINYPKMSGFVAENFNVTSGLHEFLQYHPADILIMFTHHRNFPRSLTTPSVTSITLHHLNTPLLVMPPENK
ncbi:MAG: universal stress protein [Bacteroidota bacterium]